MIAAQPSLHGGGKNFRAICSRNGRINRVNPCLLRSAMRAWMPAIPAGRPAAISTTDELPRQNFPRRRPDWSIRSRAEFRSPCNSIVRSNSKGRNLKPDARLQYPIFPGFVIHFPRHAPNFAMIGQFAAAARNRRDGRQTFIHANERAFGKTHRQRDSEKALIRLADATTIRGPFEDLSRK